jgi:hypothetical protein
MPERGETSERLDVMPAQFRVIVTTAPNMPAGLVKRRWFRRQHRNG